MKSIAFDLGDTLIEYEGLPLNWEAHYPSALQQLGKHLTVAMDAAQLENGCAILRKYNTRLHPREQEITFSTILRELCVSWGIVAPASPENAARLFFQTFRQRLRCFPETKAALQSLRQKGYQIGIFTDVPYGMPRELVLDDVKQTGIDGLYDVLLTSQDIGYRKPCPQTLTFLATAMKCPPTELVHVGNERKDIEVARAVGCHSVLINRTDQEKNWGQQRTVESLTEFARAMP